MRDGILKCILKACTSFAIITNCVLHCWFFKCMFYSCVYSVYLVSYMHVLLNYNVMIIVQYFTF